MAYYADLINVLAPDVYLKFARNANDATSNARNATAHNVTYNTTGALAAYDDGSAHLNGSTSYLTLPAGVSTNNLSGFTIAFWFRSNFGYGQGARIVANSHTDADGNGFQFEINGSGGGGYTTIGLSSGQKSNYYSYSWQSNVWYHFAYLYNSGAIGTALYINGQHVTGDTNVSGTVQPSSYPIAIGYNPAYQGDYFPGDVDEWAFWSRAIDATNFPALYNAGLTLPPIVSRPPDSLALMTKQNINSLLSTKQNIHLTF